MHARLALASLLACASSCDDAGSGTVVFTTYGEELVERQIPPSDVADGWTIAYHRFLVTFHDVSVGEPGAAPIARMSASKLFDQKVPGDKAVVTFTSLPAKAYRHVSYRIAPAAADTELGAGVTEADKRLMVTNGYAIYVEATATKGDVAKSFEWGFSLDTLYDGCRGMIAGKQTDGAVVTTGGTDTIQLTIHGDHLYYDDLQSPEARVRFDNIAAADADDDGFVTLEELGAVKLAAIPRDAGAYGTGSAAGIHDLRAFVEALSRTVGHFRGEGECFASVR